MRFLQWSRGLYIFCSIAVFFLDVDMNKEQEISLAIGRIINSCGGNVLQPEDKMKYLLMDLLPKYANERRLIWTALHNGVGIQMYESWQKSGTINDQARRSCKRRLQDAFVADEAAEMVIAWLEAAFAVRERLPVADDGPQGDTRTVAEAVSRKAVNNGTGIEAGRTGNTAAKVEESSLLSFAQRFLSASSRSGRNSRMTGSNAGNSSQPIGRYIFDEGIASIEPREFAGASQLREVIFTNSITKVGDEAFANCTLLKNTALLYNMTQLGNGIFKGCSSLERLGLPATLSHLPRALCKRCSSLINVNLPQRLREIGDEAFRECTSLQELRLPDGLESIGNRAFMGCSGLQKLRIGRKVKYIGRDAFLGCGRDFSLEIDNNTLAIRYCILHKIKYTRL